MMGETRGAFCPCIKIPTWFVLGGKKVSWYEETKGVQRNYSCVQEVKSWKEMRDPSYEQLYYVYVHVFELYCDTNYVCYVI